VRRPVLPRFGLQPAAVRRSHLHGAMITAGKISSGLAFRHPAPQIAEPCAFRRAAVAALDEAGIPWRIALVSASLAAVRAAVGAGFAITVRTAEFIQSLGGGAHEIERLPKLPQKQLCLYRRVPVITSRTGSALHRECLEKLTVG
jgi:DNA-binding transcriptional LysR family regulator